MADINLTGIDLSSGKNRPITSADVLTTNDNIAVRGFQLGASQGMPGIGPQGQPGLTGDQGQTGTQGLTGVLGNQGITGALGIRGVTGMGVTGLQGATGIQGSTGIVVGETGVQGLTGSGSFARYSSLAGATTITYAAELIGLASTGGSFVVTLPSATGMQQSYIFQDEAGAAGINNISIWSEFVGGGPDGKYGTINGATGVLIDAPYMALEIFSTGNKFLARTSKLGTTGLQGLTGVEGATGI